MFGPVFAAAEAGDYAEVVRRLLDGSGQQPGYFDSQPQARRAVQLDNARVIPLLLSQSPPPPLTCAQLGQIAEPVAIAWGERTRPLFGVVARAAAACIPGGAHTAVEGATHMWPEEDPQGFCRLVRRFVDAH